MNLKKLSKLFTKGKTSFGANLTFWDELEPEQSAMVQSLNSRSAGGFWKNFLIVMKEGFEKFMAKFYSNYGHKSIADCGSTTGAADNISMLAAKELQNWWAYNGQETSTRYVDVTGLGYLDPVGSEVSKQIMERWFDFYKKALQPTIDHLKTIRPRKTEGEKPEDEEKYNVMIEKRAYDVLGSFLPAGTKTNASCHMELRQWDDKLAYMIHHPLPEIAELAKEMLSILTERYPSTFDKKKVYEDSENYRKEYEKEFAYVISKITMEEGYEVKTKGFLLRKNFQDDTLIQEEYRKLLETRPPKTDPPKILNEAGSYQLQFLIDFRSHRDWQRQRSALQRVPLLTTKNGFETWYLQQLPETVRIEAERLLIEQSVAVDTLPCDTITKQYYIAMGYTVFNVFTVSLADLIYIIELRTPTTVHPTARRVALQAYEALKQVLPDYVKIYAETNADDFNIKRAEQDLFLDGKRISKM